MKKIIMALMMVVSIAAIGCAKEPEKDYSGTYTGYSWKDEVKGTALADAVEKIETTLTLDQSGVITDAKVLFYKLKKDGTWTTRQDNTAEVTVDFTVDPTAATPEADGQEYADGNSMFKIKTVDLMSFYAVAVDGDSTIALTVVEPFTRYRYELKMKKDFDFNTKIKDMTVGNGLLIPTFRASTSGKIKPKDWSELADKHLLGMDNEDHIITGTGIFSSITPESTIKELLEKAGVVFEENDAVQLPVQYGFFGVGGWAGNYAKIESFLVGKNALELKSLIDWNNPRYKGAINDEGYFGIDAVGGATKTVQNSVDGIAGATVRMSREAESYQRALVEAGILTEKEVVKGKF